jgi:hypothetical protein
MKAATMHNAQSSAPTSRSARRSEVNLSEADYLAREVADAKAALSHAIADLKTGLITSADLRRWVTHYPWAAVGAATVAGFAAGAAVTPAPGESIGEKLSKLRPPGQKNEPAQSTAAATGPYPMSPNVKSTVITSLFDLAKLLAESLIIATFRAPAPSQESSAASADRLKTRATAK